MSTESNNTLEGQRHEQGHPVCVQHVAINAYGQNREKQKNVN